MTVYIIAAFLIAFLFSIIFGKRYISWLEKKGVWQPLKDEVAKIYDQTGDSIDTETSKTP